MGLYDEAMDTLYRATWDYAWHSAAYFELAQISCIQGDFVRALHQVNESLSTNRRNHRAISLKASILRKQGQANDAIPILTTMLEQDPLNFRGMNELYLSYKASGNTQAARKLLADLNEKMRGFDQNYLEVAVGYLNEGMLAEADNMLNRFEGENPIVHYYLGFIADKKGDKVQAKRQFALGQSLPEEGCFPFRLETVNVLKKAIEYDNRDGKAYYYLGNILYQKQPEVAIAHWESATKRDPQLAMAFRNLGWGYYRHHKDIPKAIAHYERALALENNEAILYEELDRLYELNNSPIEARLKIFEGHNDVVKRRDDAFIRQIGVLTLAGEADKSVEYLKDKVFSYREGSSQVRETIIDAHLSLGMKYLDEQKNQEALEQFLIARSRTRKQARTDSETGIYRCTILLPGRTRRWARHRKQRSMMSWHQKVIIPKE